MCLYFPLVFEQFVLNAVDQRVPVCLDNIFRDANGTPQTFGVAAFDDNAHFCGRDGSGVDHAHLVVDQVQGFFNIGPQFIDGTWFESGDAALEILEFFKADVGSKPAFGYDEITEFYGDQIGNDTALTDGDIGKYKIKNIYDLLLYKPI